MNQGNRRVELKYSCVYIAQYYYKISHTSIEPVIVVRTFPLERKKEE